MFGTQLKRRKTMAVKKQSERLDEVEEDADEANEAKHTPISELSHIKSQSKLNKERVGVIPELRLDL